jgi:hypothetical protein
MTTGPNALRDDRHSEFRALSIAELWHDPPAAHL